MALGLLFNMTKSDPKKNAHCIKNTWQHLEFFLSVSLVTKKREGRKGNWKERVKYKERRGKAKKWKAFSFLWFIIDLILATR